MSGGPGISPEVLAALVEDVRAGRLSVDEALAAHPAAPAELRDLLEVAAAIAPPPPLEPDAAFRARARSALLTQIAAEREARPPRGWLLDRLFPAARIGRAASAAVGGLLVLVVAGGGAVYASQEALPGDALYPVKRSVEEARVALAPEPRARAELHRELAVERAEEAERAIRLGRPAAAEQAARAFVAEVARAEQAGGPATASQMATPRAAAARARDTAPPSLVEALSTAAAAAEPRSPSPPSPGATAPDRTPMPPPAAAGGVSSPSPSPTATATPTPTATHTPTSTSTPSPTPTATPTATATTTATVTPARPPGAPSKPDAAATDPAARIDLTPARKVDPPSKAPGKPAGAGPAPGRSASGRG